MFLATPLAAREYEIVPLPLHRSLSTLLYDREFSPLYGPRGKLNEVLELNGLTEESARKLRPNHPLKIPLRMKPQRPEHQLPPTPSTMMASSRHLLKAALGYYVYQSDSNSGSNFSAYGPMVAASYTWSQDFSLASASLIPYLEAFYVDKLGDSFQYNYGLQFWAHKKFEAYRIGLGVTYTSLFYIHIDPQGPESERYAVPGVLGQIERSWDAYTASLTAGMNLAHNSSEHDISASPLLRILGQKNLSPKTRVNAQLEVESRKIDNDKQVMGKFSLGLDRRF